MKLALIVVSLFSSALSFACPIPNAEMGQHFNRIAYDNTQTTPLYSAVPGAATEKEFKEMINKARMLYTPVFQRSGFRFRIEAAWNDNTINAYASEFRSTKNVAMYGGYARGMTRDSFLTVLCHEIGHHLAGFPRYTGSAMSSEGQADYFSTLRCMKAMLRGDVRNQIIALKLNLPQEIKRACQYQYGMTEDYYICLRGAKAAEDYGQQQASRSGSGMKISLATPSTDIVNHTQETHPEPQCRADTKLQGILCNVPITMGLSIYNEKVGTCNGTTGHRVGMRPACWFAAAKN